VSIQDVAADCSYFTVKVNINAADAIYEAVKGEKPGDQPKKSDALWNTYKEYFDRIQDGNQDDRTKALFKVTKLTVKPRIILKLLSTVNGAITPSSSRTLLTALPLTR
jgi:hypothetical protein